MAGPSQVQLVTELTFLPNATDLGSVAYFPDKQNPYFDRLTVYVLFSHNAAAGKVQLQSAPYHDYPNSNTWANEGSEIAWVEDDSVKALHIDGVYGALRLEITEAVTAGTVRAIVIGVHE